MMLVGVIEYGCGVGWLFDGWVDKSSDRPKNSVKNGKILRDGIASGRGVHRKMGVRIQESRSNFGLKSQKLRKFGKSGVGVL